MLSFICIVVVVVVVVVVVEKVVFLERALKIHLERFIILTF